MVISCHSLEVKEWSFIPHHPAVFRDLNIPENGIDYDKEWLTLLEPKCDIPSEISYLAAEYRRL